jgi:putative phosphoserine phosphatase / 1-acylglycerol-3-phosphate O-acyltransferase
MSADRPEMRLLGGVRNLAGVGSLLPVALGAAGIGLLTRNKRAGVNFLTAHWPQLLLRINGVSLNVLGRENLTTQRPAVFIFNHRNNFDAAMTAALVRDNWTGVGKKELESDPISGTLGKLLDTAFIDRDDPQSAVQSLHKIEELARRGLSVLIAPEGTRVDTAEVGPFKKGPFRIAMSAGIPIVPIVIRNAERVAARNASTLNPGTVDIAVFPPIPTADWTIRTLPRRIAAIRQLYVDTLTHWPPDDVHLANRARVGRPARQKATPTTRAKEPS